MEGIEKNWARTGYDIGPTCRFVTSNPVVGFGGGFVGQVLLEGENGHTIHHGFTQDGQYNVNTDGVYTLSVGGKVDSGPSLNLIANSGNACMTANNGDVMIRGRKVIIDACSELIFNCGGNVLFKGKDNGNSNSIRFNTINLSTNAEQGNLVPRKVTFGGQCFANTAVGGLAQQSAFVAGAMKAKVPEIKDKLKTLSGNVQEQAKDLLNDLPTDQISENLSNVAQNFNPNDLTSALNNFPGFGV